MYTPRQRIEGVATQPPAFTKFRSTAPRQAIAAFCTQTWEILHRTRFIAGSGIVQSPRRSTTASMDLRGRVAQKLPDNLPIWRCVVGALGRTRFGLTCCQQALASVIEEDYVPGIPVSERHQDLVTSWLRSGELHRGIVGEHKANSCPQFLHAACAPCV